MRGTNFRCHKRRLLRGLRLLRDGLERRNRLVDNNPGQFIFEEDRFPWRERCRVVERRNGEINCVRVYAVFEKQMRAATSGK